jgi:hypothetical protein
MHCDCSMRKTFGTSELFGFLFLFVYLTTEMKQLEQQQCKHDKDARSKQWWELMFDVHSSKFVVEIVQDKLMDQVNCWQSTLSVSMMNMIHCYCRWRTVRMQWKQQHTHTHTRKRNKNKRTDWTCCVESSIVESIFNWYQWKSWT